MEKQLYKLFYELEDTNWWFVATRRFVLRSIAKYLPTKNPDILDAGCGTGATTKALSRFGTVHGIDISKDAIAYARKRGLKNVQLASITNLPFADNSFDIVVALDVIEHVKKDSAALAEIRRVLRPNGVTVIAVPAFPQLWSTHDKLNHHFRRYTNTQLLRLVSKHGFSVILKHNVGFTTFFPLLTMALLERWKLKRSWSFFKPVNPRINKLLTNIFTLDLHFCSVLNPPLGTSIFLIAKKVR